MIDLYTWMTPNGQKASIMLEETGLPYRVHRIDIENDAQFDPAFLKISPNNKIPAIVDHDTGLSLMESGAILLYLADKTGMLLPQDFEAKWRTIEWLMWQMGGAGPMFGQLGFFHKFAGKDYEDKRPRDRYARESARLIRVLESRLDGRDWIMGDEYTIADIAMLGWVRNLIGFYGAGELVQYDELKHVPRWLERGLARPAVDRGLNIPTRP